MTETQPSEDVRETLRLAAEHSRLVATIRAFEGAADDSRAVGVHRRLVSVAYDSRLVGWLHRRPDAGVTVIDLRRTRTLGWALGPLDSAVGALQRRWAALRSKLRPGVTAPLIEGVRRSWLAATVLAFLRPPESPREDHSPTDDDRK